MIPTETYFPEVRYDIDQFQVIPCNLIKLSPVSVARPPETSSKWPCRLQRFGRMLQHWNDFVGFVLRRNRPPWMVVKEDFYSWFWLFFKRLSRANWEIWTILAGWHMRSGEFVQSSDIQGEIVVQRCWDFNERKWRKWEVPLSLQYQTERLWRSRQSAKCYKSWFLLAQVSGTDPINCYISRPAPLVHSLRRHPDWVQAMNCQTDGYKN